MIAAAGLSLRRGMARCGFCLAAASSTSAEAHSFGKLYNLPIPFWLYLWGAAGALLLSFLIVGCFATERSTALNLRTWELRRSAGVLCRPGLIATLRGLTLGVFALCIATGLFGSRNPYLNLNMTVFWIVYVLGFTYFTALVGDWYTALNPWRAITDCLPRFFAGQMPYPPRWGFWPAFCFYLAFIGVELFAQAGPRGLSWILLAYSALTLAGAWCFGRDEWLVHGEFFAVFFRLVARMAPVDVVYGRPGWPTSLHLRAPFAGLLANEAKAPGEVLFVLFMLSSTAFDGLRETAPCQRLFWLDLRHALEPWVGTRIVTAFPILRLLNIGWEALAMAISPFVYFVAYLAAIGAMRAARSRLTTAELVKRFIYTLLPIALAYHVTHYYTLVITQGTQMLRLASDPFGRGWNLFGTALWMRTPVIPDMDTVWHTQVGLILVGHIVAVYLAHLEALRVFPSRTAATVSQLPMLLLMVAFTSAGLWILAQPITSTYVAGG